jgi:Uma2 family endonuclease
MASGLLKVGAMQPGYSQPMRAVWLEVPEEFLAERARWGAGRRDEVWAGVLHMVPEPTIAHVDFEFALHVALKPIVERRGLRIHQGAAIRDPAVSWSNYRKPDLIVAHPANESEAAVDGPAEVVIEVLSPNDESRDKFSFYASRGVREIWLVDPKTRAFEVHALAGDSYEVVGPADGVVRAPALGVELELVAGPQLCIRDGEYLAVV